jgi:sugar/nucleoside kinase (ribokinase family)
MVAQDGAGERYRAALAAEGVEPLLLVAAGDGNDASDTATTARCLCLVTPDGERTMRTCLGAASTLCSADAQLGPRGWLEIELPSAAGSAPPPSPPPPSPQNQQPRMLVHLEGYTLYRPQLAAEALRAARRRGGQTSLDLASFELVRARWQDALLPLLREGLVDLLFCNEDEARELAEAAGLGVDSGEKQKKKEKRGAKAPPPPHPEMCPQAAAAQRFLVEQGARACVVSLGARGCAALAADRDKEGRTGGKKAGAASKAAGKTEAASARGCSLRSPLIDTVGAGDTFTAGFLFAWLGGASLAGCCELACAAGAEVVQVAGASLGDEAWRRLAERAAEALRPAGTGAAAESPPALYQAPAAVPVPA